MKKETQENLKNVVEKLKHEKNRIESELVKENKIRMYVKLPKKILAMQYDGSGERAKEIIEWTKNSKTPAYMENGLYIKTLEGNHKVSYNDYVLKGISGEFYPCKPDIFKSSYELYETH